MAKVELKNLTKKFDEVIAVNDMSLVNFDNNIIIILKRGINDH